MAYYYTREGAGQDDGDAQLAADMQLAYDIQAAEEQSREYEQQLHRLQQQLQQEDPGSRGPSPSPSPSPSPPPPSHHARAAPRALNSFPGAASAATHHRDDNIPVVQGRAIPFPLHRSARSASSSWTGGAQSAIASDGFSMQQHNMSLIYVPTEINDRLVEMMVDTGAQSSVISSQLMYKLGLQSKLDKRMQGMAQGVGQARISGLIENCPVQIGHVEFLLYFLVLDVPQDMIILGIDQMRRFKCQIDLENDKLIFGGKDGVEVSFLPPEVNRGRAVSSGCSIS